MVGRSAGCTGALDHKVVADRRGQERALRDEPAFLLRVPPDTPSQVITPSSCKHTQAVDAGVAPGGSGQTTPLPAHLASKTKG